MVCSDGAPQVSKPARAPAGAAGGGEEEGTGLGGCVGSPVPVGAGVGHDGGIQEGGAGLVGQGPGVGVPADGCATGFGAVVPVGADCWVIRRTPARTCMISSALVPYVAVMAGALSGVAT